MSDIRPAAVMVLAAGAGTRMKSATPKVLHTIAGRSLLHHALAAAEGAGAARTVVVVRHEREAVVGHVAAVAPDALIADQDDVPGTGRAVYCGLSVLDATAQAAVVAAGKAEGDALAEAQITGPIIVTSGDVPLIDAGTLRALAESHVADASAVTVLTAEVADPTGYGRIVRDADTGEVLRIVEEADASDAEREIAEINTGIYVFDAGVLRTALQDLSGDNAQGELYLTDVLRIAREAGGTVRAIATDEPEDTEGVNDRVQLARAAATMNQRLLESWMREGVTVTDPTSTWIDVDVQLAADVTLLPGTQLLGATTVASGATIGPDTTLRDVVVGERASVVRTHGTEAEVGAGATVGPFSYLRPGTRLGADGKIGAFVETKNATIGRGTKVPHLSYVGDATIGEESNIGAATIFVNYDGVNKNHTTVGSHVKIGSDNTLVAPVTIGDGAYTGAGSTIRRDVPAGSLGFNRSPQQNVDGWTEARRPGTPEAAAAAKAREEDSATEGLSSGAQEERAAARAADEGEQ